MSLVPIGGNPARPLPSGDSRACFCPTPCEVGSGAAPKETWLSMVTSVGNSGGAETGGKGVGGGVVTGSGGTSDKTVAGDTDSGGGEIGKGMETDNGAAGEEIAGTVDDGVEGGWGAVNVVLEEEIVSVTSSPESSLCGSGVVTKI
jgi:hypothetical protein